MAGIFRKSSLARLSSPEQLDTLITVTSPRNWMAVICIGAVIGCAIAWGVLGRIPVKVDTAGILISSGGNINVSSVVSGKVSDVRVDVGDKVKQGDVMVIVGSDGLVDEIGKNEEIINELENLHPYSDWKNISVSKELLELQQLGLQIQSASKAARNAGEAMEEYRKRMEKCESDVRAIRNNSSADSSAADNALEASRLEYKAKKMEYETAAEEESILAAKFNASKNANLTDLKKSNDGLRKDIKEQYNIVAPYDGDVSGVAVTKGSLIGQGTAVATVAKSGSDVKKLEAVFYVPVSDGKKLSEGMEVKIYPSTVQKEEYGYMKATITEVPEYPVSGNKVLNTLGNQALAQELTGQGTPLEVHAELTADANTVSGFAWSGRKGKSVAVQNGTLCQASVVVEEKRPISMVIPILKQKILPLE